MPFDLRVVAALALVACGAPDPAPPAEPPSQAALSRDLAASGPAPDCALASTCPELAVPADRCVDDAQLFVVSHTDGEVYGVELAMPASSSGLSSGLWHTIVPSSDPGCAGAVVAQFEVPEVTP